ncbi:MAG: phosphoribosylanthranilate isomerase [Ekhidna sp.]
MRELKLKVCGMRDSANISLVAATQPDYMGFIFYPKSPRDVRANKAFNTDNIPERIEKVGVFVNARLQTIRQISRRYGLDVIQLHGDESAAFAKSVQDLKVKVIKAFRVADKLPENLDDYEGSVDYFLFDTSTPSYGGSGKQFDWSVLKSYDGSLPFFLSGGIGLDDIANVKTMEHPRLYGIDVNSKVEIQPGLKNPERVKQIRAMI